MTKCCPAFQGTETIWLAGPTGMRLAALAWVCYCPKHGARGDLKPVDGLKRRELRQEEWERLKAARKGFAPFYVVERDGRYLPDGDTPQAGESGPVVAQWHSGAEKAANEAPGASLEAAEGLEQAYEADREGE